ncbi:response regulator transcription factor [Panacagrimonas sp.]|uniref:response regulator transcription factor n=1 Tax=Panacagrimonas sp. TaxID=2480088 RepID=UPI003B521699
MADPEHAARQAEQTAVVWVDATRLDWIASLKARRADLVLVALSLNPAPEEGIAAFELGVRGYCHALASAPMLNQVALVVTHGGLWLGAELMARTAAAIARVTVAMPGNPAVLDSLTPRERDVALQVAEGASNKEIARRLNITPRTVKAHMGAIFDKLDVRDRLQLVLLLRRPASGE